MSIQLLLQGKELVFLNLIITALKNSHRSLATAESCTGGLLSTIFTSTPGSSLFYLGGVSAYSNQVKVDLLGVDPLTIEKHGAVSSQVAEQMAQGAKMKTKSDYGLATTGIAGPSGGTLEKPVGTVWIGICGVNDECHSFLLNLNGSRDEIRFSAASEALYLFSEEVKGLKL